MREFLDEKQFLFSVAKRVLLSNKAKRASITSCDQKLDSALEQLGNDWAVLVAEDDLEDFDPRVLEALAVSSSGHETVMLTAAVNLMNSKPSPIVAAELEFVKTQCMGLGLGKPLLEAIDAHLIICKEGGEKRPAEETKPGGGAKGGRKRPRVHS